MVKLINEYRVGEGKCAQNQILHDQRLNASEIGSLKTGHLTTRAKDNIQFTVNWIKVYEFGGIITF